ncbi:hypothetical protein PC115_g20224 [Phytophthora cactorum]|uniref:Uncharacterized protein n=1 Tax=Phytophthora cactorum TaxID=29920 RepID=A0A8T1AV44_9STRA|nr:hypothetical protein PC115_g20224 [Phytophthora cactorum]KAG2995899.1 hypothetical protein PC120_g21624 [Phytophthora cactorum]
MEMPKGTGSTLSPPTPPIHHNDTSSMPRRPKNKNKEKHKGATSELSAVEAATLFNVTRTTIYSHSTSSTLSWKHDYSNGSD